MTTLPQTSPIRAPRPSSGHITIPSPGMVNVPSSMHGSKVNQLDAGDVMRVLRSHMWLIISLVAFSLIAGFFANMYLKKYCPRYTAEAFLRVETPIELISPVEAQPANIEIEQKSQATQLMADSLWLSALEHREALRQTGWFIDYDGPEAQREALEDNFRVYPIPDSRLIQVSMRYKRPEDAAVILSEIVNQHILQQRDFTTANFVAKAKPIRQYVEDMENDLRGLLTRISQLSKVAGQQGVSIPQMELSKLLDSRSEVMVRYQDATGKASYLTQLLSEGKSPPELRQALNQDPTYHGLREGLARVDSMIRSLEGGTAGAASVQLNGMYAQRAGLAQSIEDHEKAVQAQLIEELNAQYHGEIESCKNQLQEIDKRMAAQQEQLQVIELARTEQAAKEAEAQLKRNALEEARNTLNELHVQASVGERTSVQWAVRPVVPNEPSFPRLPITMAAAGALGLCLALAIAFIRELTDTSVRSPRDIARVGQINLLGLVPDQADDPQSSGAELPLVIFERPHSAIAEQFRQIRTRLQHAASLDTTRSILITGASAGDGKTTVACNLAAGLALNGRRILLVDANFRRPELHNVFATDNEVGLSTVLDNLESFDQCVRETKVRYLSVMTSGPKPGNPTELLESQLLIDFIERALEEYDHVIFDSGPLPLVSETVALAPRVDGVVTVARARTNSRGLIQRVRDILRQVKAEHLGMILNAVRAQAGGYYGRNILDYYRYQNGAPTTSVPQSGANS